MRHPELSAFVFQINAILADVDALQRRGTAAPLRKDLRRLRDKLEDFEERLRRFCDQFQDDAEDGNALRDQNMPLDDWETPPKRLRFNDAAGAAAVEAAPIKSEPYDVDDAEGALAANLAEGFVDEGARPFDPPWLPTSARLKTEDAASDDAVTRFPATDRTINHFPLETKLEAVARLERGEPIDAVAGRFNAARRTLRAWVRNRRKLVDMKKMEDEAGKVAAMAEDGGGCGVNDRLKNPEPKKPTDATRRDLMSHKNKKLRHASLESKLEAASLVEAGQTYTKVAKQFGVDRACVARWVKNKDELGLLKAKLGQEKFTSRRKLKGGHSAKFPRFEKRLAQRVWADRVAGRPVCRRSVKGRAAEIFEQMQMTAEIDPTLVFRASNGWLDKFLRRQNFTIRRRSTSGRKSVELEVERVACFLAFVATLRRGAEYPLDNVFNMDEIPVYFESRVHTSYNPQGIDEVVFASAGLDTLHVTACLSASASGVKMKPIVVLRRDRVIPGLQERFPNLVILYDENGCGNPQLSVELIKNLGRGAGVGRRLLVWDSFRGHLAPEVKEEMKKRNIDAAVIPAGATKFVQPADVCWRHGFKADLAASFNEWADLDTLLSTGAGPKRPPVELVLRWIGDAWTALPVKLIVESFRDCGLTVALDGSEDSVIGFFEEEGRRFGLSRLRERRRAGVPSFPEEVDDEEDETVLFLDQSGDDAAAAGAAAALLLP